MYEAGEETWPSVCRNRGEMHCPECNTLVQDGAASCTSCGLLFVRAQTGEILLNLSLEAPKRRAEDQNRKRRKNDTSARCQFCGGEISSKAVRCRHCSEVVNEDFYRERAARLRSRINYASWISYILGLGALLVFRPVGVLSIAGGLVLSIIYYAIPVEPPASKKQKKPKTPFWQMIKRQFRFERTNISLPFLRGRKLVFVGTPLVAAVVGYSANILLLQQPVDDVLKRNAAFNGMEVSAHYEYWVVPGVVVYDLKEIGVRQTPIDVHTAFLEFAKEVREKRYSRIELSYRGVSKFSIDGASFQRLGDEYAKKNYDYALYRFPRLFHRSGANASQPGATDRDALMQFHKQWYGDDPMTTSVQNGLLAH